MKMHSLFFAATLTLTAGSAFAQGPVPKIAIPEPSFFPGKTNPNITSTNMARTICGKGWSTTSIRPRPSYTGALKKTQMHSLSYTVPNTLPKVRTESGTSTRPDTRKCVERSANPECYEEDHLISLELGGHPTSPDNLWPEPWFGAWNARVKDALEDCLHAMVCNGDISLEDAQKAIARDWVAAYRTYVEGD